MIVIKRAFKDFNFLGFSCTHEKKIIKEREDYDKDISSNFKRSHFLNKKKNNHLSFLSVILFVHNNNYHIFSLFCYIFYINSTFDITKQLFLIAFFFLKSHTNSTYRNTKYFCKIHL